MCVKDNKYVIQWLNPITCYLLFEKNIYIYIYIYYEATETKFA